MSILAKDSTVFDYTLAMRALCAQIVERLPELQHVEMDRVAVGFCQARRNVRHGLQASLTPLRFAGGATFEIRRKRRYTCARLFDPEGNEFLYLMNFYLPRFQDQPFTEKLTTVIHELWHIGPSFDGDLRRHEGRCYAHGSSQEAYDAHAEMLARKWLATGPASEYYEFLAWNFQELRLRKGVIVGTRYPAPRLELCQET